MEAGTRVVMSEAFKRARRGTCEGPGKHTGHGPSWIPDPEMPDDGCAACSWTHVEEFGSCTGEVLGPMFESGDAPEVDVRWQPSGLRYGYHPDDLTEVGTYDPAERAREKQASRDQDAADLTSGRKTQEQLRQENGAFSGLNVRIDLKPVSVVSRYVAQCDEWQQIAQEIAQRDVTAVAFDVSEEQRRRMTARGERPVTQEELIAEMTAHGRCQVNRCRNTSIGSSSAG